MNIGLIHIDGTMPNLALMKLSAYHKNKGDTVELIDPDIKTGYEGFLKDGYDKFYIGVIFEDNIEKTKIFAKQFDSVEIGGYYYDPEKVLPDEIEHIMPDYDIYVKPKQVLKTYSGDYSMGFTTRGCIHKCPWCIVPKKEGKIRPNADIYEFWNRKHKHLEILDNNPMAHPEHFKKIAHQISSNNLTASFHGLDVRLLNDKNTPILATMKFKPEPRFAFDTMEIEPYVLRGIKLLQKHGIKRALWYVLVGFNTTWEEDMHRILLLKKLNQRPYVMRYKTVKGIRKYADLASWVNQHQFFASMTWEEFLVCRNDRSKLHYKKYKHEPLDDWL